MGRLLLLLLLLLDDVAERDREVEKASDGFVTPVVPIANSSDLVRRSLSWSTSSSTN